MDSHPTLPILAILGGTGKEGSGLALRWASAGYPIIIGSRQSDKARQVASELNKILNSEMIVGMENVQAAQAADICILTVVQAAHQTILEDLKDCLRGKIVVDATARVDYRNPMPPSPPTAGRIAQNILGGETQVVAAFQNVPAATLKENLGEAMDVDVLVCADDHKAAEVVGKLAQAAGMRFYYAGGLDNAIVVEGLTAILISLNKAYHTKTASIQVKGIGDQ